MTILTSIRADRDAALRHKPLSAFPYVSLTEVEKMIEGIWDAHGRRDAPSEMTDVESVLAYITDEPEGESYRDAIELLIVDGWELIGCGTSRAVFVKRGGSVVAKVPINLIGVYQCVREYEHHVEHGKDGEIPIADCSLDDRYFIEWMERVEPWEPGDGKLPLWTRLVDGAQVGYDRSGTLVAYDL